MFQSLRKEADRLAFEKGASVTLGTAEMLRIYENEGLPQHSDLRQLNFNVRDHLERWCHANIRCRWEMMRDIRLAPDQASDDVLIFSFSSKKEAVRFKLTWGGK